MMYTNNVYAVEEDSKDYSNYNDYADDAEYTVTNTGASGSGLIIKIIIIFLCLIVLIWLFLALKNRNNTTDNGAIHAENVQKMRLGAEKYFFIQNNMPSSSEIKTVTLNTLINRGLTSEIIDANKKVCNDSQSFATLNDNGNNYVLKINLACSTNDKQEEFHYNKSNYACIDCNGTTNMVGDNKPATQETKQDTSKKDDNAIARVSYSCTTWSNWSDTRVIDSSLEEKTRVVVLGVKKGGVSTNLKYSDWTEYTTTPISSSSTVEVERKEQVEKVWSATKTSSSPVTESATVKFVGVRTLYTSGSTKCPSGYERDGDRCYSTSRKRGDLTYKQYNSGNYKIYNMPCDLLNTEKDSNGKYVLVYKGCVYSDSKALKKTSSSSYQVYDYQVLEEKMVAYYRSREKQTVTSTEGDVYTNDYYEEKDLPVGYVKVAGSEKIQYSYKLKKCEK